MEVNLYLNFKTVNDQQAKYNMLKSLHKATWYTVQKLRDAWAR